jgi:hypothetical protein
LAISKEDSLFGNQGVAFRQALPTARGWFNPPVSAAGNKIDLHVKVATNNGPGCCPLAVAGATN